MELEAFLHRYPHVGEAAIATAVAHNDVNCLESILNCWKGSIRREIIQEASRQDHRILSLCIQRAMPISYETLGCILRAHCDDALQLVLERNLLDPEILPRFWLSNLPRHH